MEQLAPYLKKIEDGINASGIPQTPANLYEPFRYILSIGGKRIRPCLTLVAADICGTNKENALHAAVAIELFHNFTLVHDDIMDNAPIRRNRPTVHEQWNTNIAILTGDVMMVHAYAQLAKLTPEILPQALVLFNTTAAQICEGQQMDMDFEHRIDVGMEEYIEMIRLKTAVLLGCALQLGSLGGDEKNGKALYEFGTAMGISFQVQDDYLDAYGNEETFGKQKGGDIIANKKTFLYLKYMQKATDLDKQEMLRLYTGDRIPEALKVKRVLELFAQYEIEKEMQQLSEIYFQQAMQALEKCNLPNEKIAPLQLFANQLMNRKF